MFAGWMFASKRNEKSQPGGSIKIIDRPEDGGEEEEDVKPLLYL